MSREEMERLGWDELDVLIVSGDAYVDHPAFGAAVIGRYLVANGYRVGIVAQPDWKDEASVMAMGRPKLFAGVSAGALDSMLAHYTSFRKKRSDDAYTPGGRHGQRPNRATVVYTSLIKHAFPGLPVILGGIEGSLRRAAHYDFWTDRIRRPILFESKADLLVYGMGERAILEAARRLSTSPADPRQSLRGIAGAAFIAPADDTSFPDGAPVIQLPSFEETVADPKKLMELSLGLERQVHSNKSWALQSCDGRKLWIAPPAAPLTGEQLDSLYALPFSRRAHPAYGQSVPALEVVRFSITSHRGCGGGCSFCSLALHQGRRIASRSRKSILAEARSFTRHQDFRGSVTDVGGPTANMWKAVCRDESAKCDRASCLQPSLCKKLDDAQTELAGLLAAMAKIEGIKSVRVASGIRHDLAMNNEPYVRDLVKNYTGGQLKLAPEHCCERVLLLMRKPPFREFERFVDIFEGISKAAGKRQFIVPYLLSAFPGCTDDDMRELSEWLFRRGWRPQQVQCFIPTPGTVATAMYAAGIDPSGNKIPVPRSDRDRLVQHHILLGAVNKTKGGR